jgi:hypothetical protein
MSVAPHRTVRAALPHTALCNGPRCQDIFFGDLRYAPFSVFFAVIIIMLIILLIEYVMKSAGSVIHAPPSHLFHGPIDCEPLVA